MKCMFYATQISSHFDFMSQCTGILYVCVTVSHSEIAILPYLILKFGCEMSQKFYDYFSL